MFSVVRGLSCSEPVPLFNGLLPRLSIPPAYRMRRLVPPSKPGRWHHGHASVAVPPAGSCVSRNLLHALRIGVAVALLGLGDQGLELLDQRMFDRQGAARLAQRVDENLTRSFGATLLPER